MEIKCPKCGKCSDCFSETLCSSCFFETFSFDYASLEKRIFENLKTKSLYGVTEKCKLNVDKS